MKDFSKGLKVGALSGIIYGALGYLTQQIIYFLSRGYEIPFYVISTALIGALFGLILGIIVGIIFAVVYKSLPGTTSLIKGIIFSIFIWLFVSFLLRYLTSDNRFYFSEYTQRTIIVDLILFIFFGILLGMFWDKFTELERRCPKCQKVIPKDAILCPYCGKKLKQV